VIFIDSNIPMYVVGAAHENKWAARSLLERSIDAGERLVTDAEVLQEMLHRYGAISRLDAIQPAFDTLLGVVDEVFGVDLEDVERAKTLFLLRRQMSARDAIHVATMQRHRVTRIMSFDSGFDGLPGIERIYR
jgi:predicted nucleic acid-binding protein